MVYSGNIFVGSDYVSTYLLAYTLNQFPFFLMSRSFFSLPQEIKLRWYIVEIIFVVTYQAYTESINTFV